MNLKHQTADGSIHYHRLRWGWGEWIGVLSSVMMIIAVIVGNDLINRAEEHKRQEDIMVRLSVVENKISMTSEIVASVNEEQKINAVNSQRLVELERRMGSIERMEQTLRSIEHKINPQK